MIRDRMASAIVAQSSLMQDETSAFIHGARLVHGFGLVLVSDKPATIFSPDDEVPVVGSNATSEDLFNALRQVIPDAGPLRRPRARRASQFGLSAREHEIAELVAKGLSNRKISDATGLQEQTVKNMVSTVIRRLSCENRTQVALKLAGAAIGMSIPSLPK